MMAGAGKILWSGLLVGVQPRIRLLRSFDERQHSYPGYVLRVRGECSVGEVYKIKVPIGKGKILSVQSQTVKTGEFLIAVGQEAHEKHRFRAGMELSGQSEPVDDPRMETAEFYKTSGLKVVKDAAGKPPAGPPFLGVPPDLPTYRARGHRRLDTRTYETKCAACMWGCRMPVEMIVDHWNPSQKKYRFETFCYGPKNCPTYRPGPTRKVPGRKGMSYTEEDWVDEDATSHRGPDD